MPAISRDLVLGLLLAAYSLFMAFVGIPFGIDSPEEVPNPALSPRLWPDIIIAITAFLAVLMILRAIFGRKNAEGPEPAGSPLPPVEEGGAVDPTMEWQGRTGTMLTLVGIAFLLLTYPVLNIFGLLIGSVILMAAFSLLYRERQWGALIGCAIGIPLVCYLFFEKVANIPIPMGLMSFLEG